MDEPTNGELARGIADLKAMLTAVVSRAEYEAWKDGQGYRLAELARRDDEERAAREADVRELHARLDEQARAVSNSRQHWRSLIWTGALPAMATILAAVLTYLITRGGH